MKVPSYLRHLESASLVDSQGIPIGQNLGYGLNTVLTPFTFAPGILLDNGSENKPRLVPNAPITLYNPLNPFEQPVTVTPDVLSPTLSVSSFNLMSPSISKNFVSPGLNVTITGNSDDVNRVLSLLKSLR